jgi:pyruvate kinase
MGIKHFALSFAGSSDEVKEMKSITGHDSFVISKVESRRGLLNLDSIINETDAILIDRGDLSREVRLEKIPFLQRRIVATSRALNTQVYVATNLLESMMSSAEPTRAEINDVVSTLLMGANGLVLAAETAIGNYPVQAVQMIRKLINQLERWTPNSSIKDILTSIPKKK